MAASASVPDYKAIKARQRALREAWPQPFALRIHRSASWIGRAEQETEDRASSFLFLWIAFNAAYGGERNEPGERDAFGRYFDRLSALDAHGRLYDLVWTTFPGPIRMFLENRYVFAPFWRFHHGDADAEDWEARFDFSRRRFHAALRDKDTVLILSMLFDRLYVLRNQLIHGGATWNSGTNRDQLRDGAAILKNFVPVMVDLMMDAPDEDWGQPMYPVVDA